MRHPHHTADNTCTPTKNMHSCNETLLIPPPPAPLMLLLAAGPDDVFELPA